MAEAASSARRRLQSIHRHLLPSPPPIVAPIPVSALMESSPVIIGGMVLDVQAKPSGQPRPGTTTPGKVKYLRGGVGRNIAECMSKLGSQPFLISVVGNDIAGDLLLRHWKSVGLCTDGILQVPDVTTPVVSNIFDCSGELIAGVASVEAVENFLTSGWINNFHHIISSAPLVMVDANLPPQALQAACQVAEESGVPMIFEPVSVIKSSRIVPIAKYITCISPNENELVAMANALSSPGQYNFVKLENCMEKGQSVEYLFKMLSPAIFFLLEKGIKLLLVTLGSNGVFVCCKGHPSLIKDHWKCKVTPFSEQLLEKLKEGSSYERFVNSCEGGSSRTCVFHFPAVPASVTSLTGAGDCLVGGVLTSLCGGLDVMQSVAVGIAVAKAAVESEANVPANFSIGNIADEAKQTLLSAKKLWYS